ncbi:MAG TPA: hypothetical protein VFZ69_08270 [Longimicrobiales bacterium]
MRNSHAAVTLLLTGAVLAGSAAPSHAIPAFARKYNVSCSMCHAPVPRLNAFGEQFAANGFEFAAGEEPRDTIDTGDPLLRLLRRIDFAVRMDLFANLTAPIRNDATDIDLQTPYNIKLLTGGVLADGISFYMYFFLSERGEVAGLEDAYVQFTDIGGSGISAIVGQFQVSDPLFKRELRLQYEDYQAYRVRVGEARADLTYDRGILAGFSPWDDGDVSLMVVTGQGLSEAGDDRLYDTDNAKSVAARYSHSLGPLRLGAFGYYGQERANGSTDDIVIWGPDATLDIGMLQLNAQFLRREDTNPLFLGTDDRTIVNSAFLEAIYGPFGTDGRWAVAGLYNWIDADAPIVSLRSGEDAPLARYHTVSAGLHYLLWRNVRLMGETGYDIEAERTRFTVGATLAF